MMVLIVRTALR